MANNRDWLHTQKPMIDRIVFDCHGNAGKIALNASHCDPLEYVNAHPSGYPGLNELVELMSPDATIMFLSCLTGRSQPGTRFLTELSNNLKNKQITAFAVYNAGSLPANRPWESAHGLINTVDPLSAERIRKKLQTDLPANYPFHTIEATVDKQLKQFYAMRLDAESPYAKTAYNGYITKTPLYDAEYASMEPDWTFLRKIFMIAFLDDGTPAEKVIAETYLKRHPDAWKRYEELSQKLDRPTTFNYKAFIGSSLEN